MGTNAHLGAFRNCLLHNLNFSLHQNGGIIQLINQNFFLIISLRTTLLLSLGLVHDQRRSQFSGYFGSPLESFFPGCLFSWASLLFSFIQLSFKLLVSLQYQQESSGFSEPSVPRVSCGSLGFPRYGLPV